VIMYMMKTILLKLLNLQIHFIYQVITNEKIF
jgi:hypothetical protein